MSRWRSGQLAWRAPLRGWWRVPAWRGYLLRELSSLWVAAFALVLLAGLVQLLRGEVARDAWLIMHTDRVRTGRGEAA